MVLPFVEQGRVDLGGGEVHEARRVQHVQHRGLLPGAERPGRTRIRVHAISPGPLKTRAASGIDRFDELLERVASRAPTHDLVTIDDVGAVAACLVSDAARAMTGDIAYVDGGYHIVG